MDPSAIISTLNGFVRDFSGAMNGAISQAHRAPRSIRSRCGDDPGKAFANPEEVL
jgi:hypothetical protein